jgi:hypothetical protein
MYYLVMDVHSKYIVYPVYSFLLVSESIYAMYIQLHSNMVRRMIATITQTESVVTPSGNSAACQVSMFND